MGASVAQAAKRAFVKVLLALAAAAGVAARVTRESPDPEVLAAGDRVAGLLRAGAGGGDEQRAGELEAARLAWELARRTKGKPGRPASSNARASGSGRERGAYRIQASAVMLTYNGFADALQWQRFVAAMTGALHQAWGVKHWCATLETCTKTSGAFHVHLFVQFHQHSQERCSSAFTFEGIAPHVDQNDLCGEGLCRKKMQESVDRGFFYVFANKLGTAADDTGAPCVAGNYMPCWTSASRVYPVLGKWPERLWKCRKLSHDQYEEYIFLTRDGVQARKRNLDEVKAWDEAKAETEEMERNTKRLRDNPAIFQPFPLVAAAQAWREVFNEDRLRYPLLIVLGGSATGKTEWAKSLFRNALEVKVGALEFFPDGVRMFQRHANDGLVLDDVRDLNFLVEHQEKLQGKYDARVEFASTQGGTCKYTKYLFAVPVVVTINYSTRNLGFLETNDWLKNPTNRVLVNCPLAKV